MRLIYALIGFVATSIAVIITGISVVAVVFVLNANDFGERIEIDSGELFYLDNIATEEAHEVANLLDEKWDAEIGGKKSIQLERKNDTVSFRMIIPRRYQNKDNMLKSAAQMELALQPIFPGDNVRVEFCNEYMEVEKVTDAYPARTDSGTALQVPVEVRSKFDIVFDNQNSK